MLHKLLITQIFFLLLMTTYAAVEIKTPALNANRIFIPFAKTQKISLKQLSIISIPDFEKASGKHLTFLDRLTFKAAQRKLKNSIHDNGTINNNTLVKTLTSDHPASGFHIGGFLLGLFLGPIGVLLAYVIGDNKAVKRNRARWAWVGFSLWIGILSAIALSVAAFFP